MLVRFGMVIDEAVVPQKGLVLDIHADGNTVSFRCLGGHRTRATIEQTRAVIKALTAAMEKVGGER